MPRLGDTQLRDSAEVTITTIAMALRATARRALAEATIITIAMALRVTAPHASAEATTTTDTAAKAKGAGGDPADTLYCQEIFHDKGQVAGMVTVHGRDFIGEGSSP
jgi:hypothetical protein